MFHWALRRIEAHVKLCVLALQVQRAAEIRAGLPWARIAHLLGTLKAARYVAESRTIVQRTKIVGELADLLKKLGIPIPKQLLAGTASRLGVGPIGDNLWRYFLSGNGADGLDLTACGSRW